MSRQNAEENLRNLGKELHLDGLAFDKDNTCILEVNNGLIKKKPCKESQECSSKK